MFIHPTKPNELSNRTPHHITHISLNVLLVFEGAVWRLLTKGLYNMLFLDCAHLSLVSPIFVHQMRDVCVSHLVDKKKQ